MKRIRPAKQVLIKRTRPKLNEYDYIFVDSDKVDHLLGAHERDPNFGTIFEKAGFFAQLEFKIRHLRKNKFSVIVSVLALLISAIQPGIALYDKSHLSEKTNNAYGQSEKRKSQTDSIISDILSDSAFIEKTKNIFKHDTIFLNELKTKIKEENILKN